MSHTSAERSAFDSSFRRVVVLAVVSVASGLAVSSVTVDVLAAISALVVFFVGSGWADAPLASLNTGDLA